jgi:hypothetical protein
MSLVVLHSTGICISIEAWTQPFKEGNDRAAYQTEPEHTMILNSPLRLYTAASLPHNETQRALSLKDNDSKQGCAFVHELTALSSLTDYVQL